MADVKAGTPSIFAVNGESDSVRPLPRTSFSKHGIGEVRNLQKWVLTNPKVLDEDLLVISREYDGFDKSNKRLDILALDRDGKLVVVELKLDTSGQFADLQAVNYAAMVSTLTMDMAIELLSRHSRIPLDEARTQIADFLNPDDGELPELDDHPRIIVAAGNFSGLEITSTALWLRSFGVDLKLVELAPYLAADGSMILVPRVLIPLPEAAAYIVGHEKKEEVQRRAASKSTGVDYRPFLESVVEAFTAIPSPRHDWFGDSSRSMGRNYTGFAPHAFGLRHSDVHFEWTFDTKGFTVGLHFEKPIGAGGRSWNPRMADRIEETVDDSGTTRKLERLARGKTWHWVGYTLFRDGDDFDLSAAGARTAAEAMAELLKVTSQPLQDLLEEDAADTLSFS